MQGKADLMYTSSYLVSRMAIVLWLIFSMVGSLYGQPYLSGFFMLVFIITLLSRLWGRASLRGIDLELHASLLRLFPGQIIRFKYRLKNNKLWPLIWFRWLQEIQEDGPLVPQDRDEVTRILFENEKTSLCYYKHLSWILWFEDVHWESIWEANHRGIYSISSVKLKSGDGFGLSATEKKHILQQAINIAVYPALIPVNTDLFFFNIWGTQSGARGFIDDVTMLKGTRNYQNGDSWKRINWRLAARQTTLQVNLYETITPQSIHFIIDVISFRHSPSNETDFEDALSILASVMTGLTEHGVSVGLSVPASGSFPSMCYLPGKDDLHLADMLESLAGLMLEKSRDIFAVASEWSLNEHAGHTYLVCYDYSLYKPKDSVVEDTSYSSWVILNYKDIGDQSEDSLKTIPNKILPMQALKER